MQNTQNADIQRVINLVELYRTKVGKESDIAKEAKAYYDIQEQANIKTAEDAYVNGETSSFGWVEDDDEIEIRTKHLMVNEQLLGHFYAAIAGEDADKKVLGQLLPDFYDTTVFTSEEEAFLFSHFRELVNYIIQTPCNDLEHVQGYEHKDAALIPEEVLSLIRSRVNLPAGSVVYNPFAGFGQFANYFRDCHFYCEESYSAFVQEWNDFCDKCYEVSKQRLDKKGVYEQWAWLKVALYANNIDAVVIDDACIPTSYDAVMTFIYDLPKSYPESTYGNFEKLETSPTFISKIQEAYANLRKGGDMILIVPNKALWDAEVEKPFGSFWEELVNEHAIVEIIQLPSVMSRNLLDDCCVIIAKKGADVEEVKMIDARFAYSASNKIIPLADMASRADEMIGVPCKSTILNGEVYLIPTKGCNPVVFDNEALEEVSRNEGYEPISGLRKMAKTRVKEIHSNLLFPQIYVVERPFDEELPCPLSSLGSLLTTRVRDLKTNLPEDTPWIEVSDLSHTFKGELDVANVKKAECPNIPPYIEGSKDYLFSKSGKFIDDYWAQTYSKKGSRVYAYRCCTFLDGKEDAILFCLSKDGISTAIVRATGKPIVVEGGIMVFSPKNDIDALTVIALLRLPVVFRQIQTYQTFLLEKHLDDIFVPTNKRVIFDEKQRLIKEQAAYNEQAAKLASQKTEYINEVRMRKHDMGQYIFELGNIEDLIRYYIENRETEKDFCKQIETLLDEFRVSLGELSTMLDNLSKEEQFGTPESFPINIYLSQLDKRHKHDGFKITYNPDLSSFIEFRVQKRRIDNFSYDEPKDNLEVYDEPEDSLEAHDEPGDNLEVYDEPEGTPEVYDEPEDNLEVYDEPEGSPEVYDEPEDNLEVYDEPKDNLEVYDEPEDSLEAHDEPGDNLEVYDEPEDNLEVYDEPEGSPEVYDEPEDYLDLSYQPEDDDETIDYNTKMFNAMMNPPSLYVAPNDIQRAVNNIIDNARKHGFTDPQRTDYEIKVSLSIDVERNMYKIEFRNNGNPLPEGMNKMRYGIKGEKAGRYAGTGIGGNYIKQFVEHYGGEYDIFMEDGWTVVRICLPIK